MDKVVKLVLRVGTYFLLITLSGIALFPLFWILRTSFLRRVDVFKIPPILITLPSLEAYKSVLNSEFMNFLLNSAIISVVTVAIVATIGSLSGYVLARFKIKHKEFLFFFILSTRMGPPVAFALPYYLLFSRFGLLDTYLAMIIIYLVYTMAFVTWVMKDFFEDLPIAMEESAMIDGCSRLGSFFRIALPLALPGVITCAILAFIFIWNEFFYAMVLTRSRVQPYTVQIPAYIGFMRVRWEEMCAAGILALIPAITLAIILRKRVIRGLTFGAVKG